MKLFRVRDDEQDFVRVKTIELITESDIVFAESDIVHALIRYHIDKLTVADVLRYREQILKRID